MDFKIRTYKDTDYEEVIALWRTLHLTFDGGEVESKDELHETSVRNPTTFLLLIHENKIIGTVLGTYDGRRGYIARAGIDPLFQHKGYALKLGTDLLARFRKMGVRRVMGFVSESNKSVLTFYEKFGAKLVLDTIPVTLNL